MKCRQSEQARPSAAHQPTVEQAGSATQSNQSNQAKLDARGPQTSGCGLATPWANGIATASATTGGHPVDLDQQTLARHREIELIGHGVAYNRGRWTAEARTFGLHERYTLEDTVDDSAGFRAVKASPKQGVQATPVIAFTGSDDTYDWLADLDPNTKTGQAQFQHAEKLALEGIKAGGAATTLTGHSLGGCLAQFAATVARLNARPIAEVVTFNAPGIPLDRVQAFKKAAALDGKDVPVTHYTRAEDPVSRAGQAKLPGTHVQVTSPGISASGDILKAHTQWFLTGHQGGEIKVRGNTATVGGTDAEAGDRTVVGQARRILGTMVENSLELLGIDKPPQDLGAFVDLVKSILAGDLIGSVTNPLRLMVLLALRQEVTERLAEAIEALGALRDKNLQDTLYAALGQHRSTLEAVLGPLISEAGRRRTADCEALLQAHRTRVFTALGLLDGEGAMGGEDPLASVEEDWERCAEEVRPFDVTDTIRRGRIYRRKNGEDIDLLARVEENFRALWDGQDPFAGGGEQGEDGGEG